MSRLLWFLQKEMSMAAANEGSDASLGSMPNTTTAAYAARSAWLTYFDHFASLVTRGAGSPVAFSLALAVVLLWAVTGPSFDFSENWQLVINTGTTIVTFLMVFLIQQSQNKDSIALHLKLNELLAANKKASNRMIGIEDLDEQDLREVAQFYVRLADRAKAAGATREAHSIDEEGMPASCAPPEPRKP
jgi:low affinity Fe/Cu permease